jgi:hypothetical protein
VRSIGKTVMFDDKDKDYVLLEGRWSLSTSFEGFTLPEANSVQVRCWKEMGRCTEAIAMLYRRSDNSSMSDLAGRLSVIMFEHQVIEWSDGVVRTRSQTPGAEIEIRISLLDTFAERSQREPKARGARLADPANFHHWVLK